jgi:homogentisate 1,2-dioxygenase
MPHYRRVGEVPAKRHVQFRQEGGALYTEELMSSAGFSEESALLYHRHSPMAILSAEELDSPAEVLHDNTPVLPRHLRLHDCPEGGDPVSGRRLMLANEDVRISYVAATETSALFRDATGDELVYIESGQATLESVFGSLQAGEGDYVVIPTHTTHRWVVKEGVRMLCLETRAHLQVPARYLSTRGQLKEGAPYSERDLRGPDRPLLVEGEEVPVLVRTRAGLTQYTYAHHPFDVVGWDGWLYPWAFSIHDFEPIVGRVHQPPPVHQTFAGEGFVVCSFVPRPFDFGAGAVPVPYAHANVDSDEVLFYVGGDFMSRAGSGIGRGSVSLHPSGFVHGPQPGSVERALGQPGTDELAVMIDTFRPLRLAAGALEVEDRAYAWTWAGV